MKEKILLYVILNVELIINVSINGIKKIMKNKQIFFVSAIALVLLMSIVGITNAYSVKKNSETVSPTIEKCSCGCDMNKADCSCGGSGSCQSTTNKNTQCGNCGQNKNCGCLSTNNNTQKACGCANANR